MNSHLLKMRSFQEAVVYADSQRGKRQLTNAQLLQLYAYFKQGSIGPNATVKPGIFDLKSKAKWDAWKGLGVMGAAEAQGSYVQLVQQWLG